FFINMITRDIALKMAILDLVDNSIDSAYQKSDTTNLNDLYIKISCCEDKFVIEDNCSGFDIETAKNYVFRFGSNNKTEQQKSSIGQFGIGLKRTIFKMGNLFKVESKTNDSSLIVEDNINDWSTRTRVITINGEDKTEDDWHFKLSENHDVDMNSTGTRITISDLHQNIKNSFLNTVFISKLISEIEIAHMVSLNNGIKIEIEFFNEEKQEVVIEKLKPVELSLINNEKIKPLHKSFNIELSSGEEVKVHMYLGVINREFNTSGVYIFCNNRTILHANKDSLMWNRDVMGKNWHHNYALFCAYIFLESEDTSLLPWTTTKEGVDQDSETFQKLAALLNLISKPILDFLRKGAHERDKKSKKEYLNMPIYSVIESSEEVLFTECIEEQEFYEDIEEASLNNDFDNPKRIQYDKPKSEIDKLKKIFKVENNYEVGIETFKRVYDKLVLGK
ncbi:MAG: ATP-binding protein, partial [Campylobacterota bacterium]|nr:ATP-binding protein [Campylobacterota bacterium]